MKKSSIVAGLTAVLLFAAATPSTAQYYAFGKNKVQYESFQWLTLKGEHVEVFYYPEEEPIARIALVLAEESYKDLAAKFDHEVTKVVPMIVYSSHHHFEQTNVSPGFLPEGVQGFTEYLKGRVVLPYTGSYAEFHHVIHHEMVHVFQFSIMDEVYKAHRRASYVVPPLWFSEGLAEYWSTPWDAQGTMVMSDMVLEGHLPTIADMWKYNGTFTIYKMGQSLCEYIGATYGQEALRRLYTEIYREDNWEKLIQRVTGVSARRLSEDWILAQKRRYFPQVKDRAALSLAAQPRAVSEGINLKPMAAPDTTLLGGYRYFFISARDGYTNIYSATYKGPERQVKAMVRGQRNPQFESFHPFQSRIDVSRQGELAFVSKWDGRDALFIMDTKSRKILVREHVPKLIAISSPAWSADGKRIAFSGLETSGQSDLYVMDRATETITRLTNDYYADSDPTWSPDGSQIAFASDRTRYGKDGHQNLFLLDMNTLEIRYLTCGPWTDSTPHWSPTGERMVFTSDRGGMLELYTVDPAGKGARMTHLLSSVQDPAWLPDGKSVLLTGFNRSSFGIYQIPMNTAAPGDSFSLDEALVEGPAPWTWEETSSQSTEAPSDYKPHYGLDLVQGGISASATENVGQGFQAAFSDLLGNKIYYFQIGNNASTASEILSRMNVSGWKINREHRWNYAAGVFHTAGDYVDMGGFDYFERRAGGSVVASYPFSRFRRVDLSMSIFYDKKEMFLGFDREGVLATHSISLVEDNSLWFGTGPRDGGRLNFTGSITTNLNTGRNENVTVLADIRRYFRMSQWTSVALRVQGRASSGADPQRFAMGGSLTMRGYPYRYFEGTRLLMANLEYRFPLLDRLVLGVPFRGFGLPGLEAAVFADAGTAWESFERFREPKGSFGFGLRTSLAGYMVLRYDFAKLTDFHTVRPGWEHEFYIGLDY
jgi:WD40 repeat protein/surface antigen Omp85-like protein